MIQRRLSSIRGQLVFRYLAVLVALLAGLGVFQAVTLQQYLQDNVATTMRQTAYSQLQTLDDCTLQTRADLKQIALYLAIQVGGHDTAVKVVDTRGAALADHGYGVPGHTHSLRLSAATIHQLIAPWLAYSSARGAAPSDCNGTGSSSPPRNGSQGHQEPPHLQITQGNLILTSVPVGPEGHPVGFALIGRPATQENNILHRAELVFLTGALVTLIVAALVALPVISRALRPLRRVALTAQAIAAGDLDQRTNLAGEPDEVGVLGRSFDTMVDRLQTALAAANASEDRMRRFLADASHELRTPLTVLRGMSEVLLRQADEEPPERAQALHDLHQEAVRLSRLVDDLLTLSRLDSGVVPAQQEVEARPFLQEFVRRYGDAWPDREIVIQTDALNGAAVKVDPDALRRVLINLVDNAARYSTPHEPITLTGEETAGRVVLAVADRGPGLTPDQADRVFERFYRTGESRARSSGGTGLGLSIVRSLVEGNGGEVLLDTGPDRGTTVRVTLPRTVPSRRPATPA